MKTLFILALVLFVAGCKSSSSRWPWYLSQSSANTVEADETIVVPGPVGTIEISEGLTWIDLSTNAVTVIETHEMHTHLAIARYVHDKEIYGNSIAFDPGWLPMGEPPDRPRAHYWHARKLHDGMVLP